MSTAPDPQSLTGLLSGILASVTGLVRNEVDLARAEVTESARSAGTAIGMIAAALVIALVALNVLTGALVGALAAAGLSAGWAALLVGGAYAAVAAILVKVAIGKLRAFSLAPKRAARNIRQDIAAIKEVSR